MVEAADALELDERLEKLIPVYVQVKDVLLPGYESFDEYFVNEHFLVIWILGVFSYLIIEVVARAFKQRKPE